MAGTLVDHTSLPCPASLLDAEVTFLLAALAPLGVIQYQRYGDQAVGLGRKMPSGQPVEAEGGFNNVAVWVFAVPDADGEGRKVSSVHLGLRADCECLPFSVLFYSFSLVCSAGEKGGLCGVEGRRVWCGDRQK